jgi:Rab proteins geranylgeranyltransferase component A
MTGSLNDLLSSPEYNLPVHLRTTIQYALTLSPTPDISAATAIHAIRRHLNGFGLFGTFPIIVPLHGGGAELSQAFCRAAAVKGATYILGRDLQSIKSSQEDEYPLALNFQVEEAAELSMVRSKALILPATMDTSDCIPITRSISVVEDILEPLFLPETLYKDAALIIVPPGTLRPEQQMPVQVIIHGGGTGECPIGQCISYMILADGKGWSTAAYNKLEMRHWRS